MYQSLFNTFGRGVGITGNFWGEMETIRQFDQVQKLCQFCNMTPLEEKWLSEFDMIMGVLGWSALLGVPSHLLLSAGGFRDPRYYNRCLRVEEYDNPIRNSINSSSD